MKKEDCFYLGKIVKKYSFKGELILRLDTDEPEIYENLNAVFIDMGKTLVPYFIENSLIQKGNHIRIRFEDIDIPNPNHFALNGTTGGPVSILNNNVLDNSDFMNFAKSNV